MQEDGRSGLKKAIADHAQRTTGQAMTDYDVESTADALVSYFALLAEADQKVMKNERTKRNPDHSDQA